MVFSHSCQNMKYMLFVRTTFRHSDEDLQRKGCSCALIFNEYNIPNNAACNCLPFASTCVSLRFFGQVRVAHLFSYLCCVVLCCVCVCVFVFVLSNVFSSVSVLSILGCPFGFHYILFTDIYIHRYSKKIQTFKMVYVLLLDTQLTQYMHISFFSNLQGQSFCNNNKTNTCTIKNKTKRSAITTRPTILQQQ